MPLLCAACDVVAAASGAMELGTIKPAAVLGPVMGTRISGSNEIVRRILEGAIRGYPTVWIPVVDVRYLASAQLPAMTTPACER